jgi:hypothetical protein
VTLGDTLVAVAVVVGLALPPGVTLGGRAVRLGVGGVGVRPGCGVRVAGAGVPGSGISGRPARAERQPKSATQ